MATDDRTMPESKVVERTGLALVHQGERIYPDEGAAALLIPSTANVVNYYFPVEIEIIGAGVADSLAERIYDALQREFSALG